jgi:hypothetical protein
MAALTALLLGLNQGHEWGWFSWQVLSLLAGSAVLLAAFIAAEMRIASPMLDLSLFRRRIFSASEGFSAGLLPAIGRISSPSTPATSRSTQPGWRAGLLRLRVKPSRSRFGSFRSERAVTSTSHGKGVPIPDSCTATNGLCSIASS